MNKKYLNLLISFFLLTGFTGQEKFIQLESSLNGRETAQFKGSKNIQTLLPKGTRAEVKGYRKFYSGNYGIKVKILSGAQAGKTLWVYYKTQNPSLKLFREKPTHWNQQNFELTTSEVRNSKFAETRREVAAQTQELTEAPKKHKTTPAKEKAKETIAIIEGAKKELQKTQTPPCTQNCLTQNLELAKPRLNTAKRQIAPTCSQIMGQDGELGQAGHILFQTMSHPENRKYFTKDQSLGALCPRFSHLNEEDKLQAWTWLWTALAHEESSCNPKVVHPTVIRDRETGAKKILNPYAGYGLWALEKDRNIRAWRGQECSDIGTIEGQIKCTVSIMKKQLQNRGTADLRSGSYWGPLHRAERQILPHMRRLSLCF